MVSLTELGGLWRRRSISWPDAEPDTTTEVYWLQGPRHYADLRIPEGRPECKATCLRELDQTMLRFLARQEGFFGTLDVCDSIGHWRRAFDYQPDTGREDRGHLAFEGDVLVEHGVSSPYVEHWVREFRSDGAMAMALAADALRGCLVAAGDAFMLARSRCAKLPPCADVSACLETSESLEAAQTLFDCEISFGRVTDQQWRIERSSLPFREGHTLKPDIDADTGTLLLDDLTPEGFYLRRAWTITSIEGDRAKALVHSLSLEAAKRRPRARKTSNRFSSNSGALQ
jgi:hypothetical protein